MLKVEFSRDDVKFLKTLKGCYWNGNYKNWVVKSDTENLKAIQSKFGVWSKQE